MGELGVGSISAEICFRFGAHNACGHDAEACGMVGNTAGPGIDEKLRCGFWASNDECRQRALLRRRPRDSLSGGHLRPKVTWPSGGHSSISSRLPPRR